MYGSSSPVRINGAGPTGSLLALGLASLNYSIDLFDTASLDTICSKSRAYALTHSSRRLLIKLDLWNDLQPFLTPFKKLRLEDRGIRKTVNFANRDLHQSNQSAHAVGWILDHSSLMRVLMRRLERSPNVNLYLNRVSVDNFSPFNNSYALIIAADGPQSLTRKQSEIPFWTHQYSQGCLTAKIRFRNINSDEAFECFRPEGPLAILPLGETDFQVVWSAPLHRCRQLASLETTAFLDQICTILPYGLEPDALLDQPAAFPLQLSFAPKLHRGNVLLVGESGHRCHPVGGQGLNLCWRDVETLLQLMSLASQNKKSLKNIPSRYTKLRFLDLLIVGFATDLLVRLFSNRQSGLLIVRRVGISALKLWPFFRRLSLQAMTDGPGTFLSRLPK